MQVGRRSGDIPPHWPRRGRASAAVSSSYEDRARRCRGVRRRLLAGTRQCAARDPEEGPSSAPVSAHESAKRVPLCQVARRALWPRNPLRPQSLATDARLPYARIGTSGNMRGRRDSPLPFRLGARLLREGSLHRAVLALHSQRSGHHRSDDTSHRRRNDSKAAGNCRDGRIRCAARLKRSGFIPARWPRRPG
jgi:hypothetical protein